MAQAILANLWLYRTPKCFPEVPDVLQQLKQQGYVTAIFSNGSPSCCVMQWPVRTLLGCQIACCPLKRLACTSFIQKSINLLLIASASQKTQSQSSRRTPGTRMQHLHHLRSSTPQEACRTQLAQPAQPLKHGIELWPPHVAGERRDQSTQSSQNQCGQ